MSRLQHLIQGVHYILCFSQEFSKVCHLSLASTRLLLVVQKNYQLIRITVHLHSVESFEGLLQRCRRGRACSELWKNTIFPEHPLFVCFLRQEKLIMWQLITWWVVSWFYLQQCLSDFSWVWLRGQFHQIKSFFKLKRTIHKIFLNLRQTRIRIKNNIIRIL